MPGQNLSIHYRTSSGRAELLPKLVSELLNLNVDVLVTLGTPVTRAAQQATRTMPIVMVTVADPVQSGFVTSLSHPGGNITGSSEMSEELAPKRIELVKEAIPKASLVAVLWDPTHPPNVLALRRTEAAARALGPWQGARSGALLSYGPDIPDQYRHAALFVDSILKGAKPADLPVKQPTKFRLAINLSTAKALDLTIPQSLLVRADDVLE